MEWKREVSPWFPFVTLQEFDLRASAQTYCNEQGGIIQCVSPNIPFTFMPFKASVFLQIFFLRNLLFQQRFENVSFSFSFSFFCFSIFCQKKVCVTFLLPLTRHSGVNWTIDDCYCTIPCSALCYVLQPYV